MPYGLSIVCRCACTGSQWLSYTKPDSADHAQFRGLCDACDELCHLKGLAPSKLFLWLDYTSIPQANATLQKLAIESLATFASSLRYFLVLAPDAIHADTLRPCNQATYNLRGWVRGVAASIASRAGHAD